MNPIDHPASDAADSSTGTLSELTTLRAFCLAEAATLLTLLLIAVPLKHMWGYTLAVSVMGPVHGLVFLTFGWLVVQTATAEKISWGTAGQLMLAACLPFGGLYSWWRMR